MDKNEEPAAPTPPKTTRVVAFVSAFLNLDDLPPETPIESLRVIVLNRLTPSDLKIELTLRNNG